MALHLHAGGDFTRWSCGSLRVRVDAQGVVDGLLERFGAGGFAYMQSARVGASEGGGDALLSFEDPSNGVPARVLAGFAQTPSDELYELVGDDSDEQRSFGSDGFVVKMAAVRVPISGSGRRLKVGEGDIGPPPRPFFVLLALFASWPQERWCGAQSTRRAAGSVASGVGERSGTRFGLKRDAEVAVRTHRSHPRVPPSEDSGGGGNQGVAGSRRWRTAARGTERSVDGLGGGSRIGPSGARWRWRRWSGRRVARQVSGVHPAPVLVVGDVT